MINQQKNNKANYEAPTLEIIEVKIEQGFAASIDDLKKNDPLYWE